MLDAGRDYRYFIFLTLGTGMSYAAVSDGRPVAGARGGALNIGTSFLPGEDPWRDRVVLDQIASGSGS